MFDGCDVADGCQVKNKANVARSLNDFEFGSILQPKFVSNA